MDSESSIQQNNKRKRDRRQWSNDEDEALLDILIEAVNQGQKYENGQFKGNTLKAAEAKLEKKFPGCGIKVKPHIESAMKRLKGVYNVVYDMLNQSGFGWDDEKKMIKVDSEDVWNEYIKSHPNAKDYRNARIPLLEKLAYAFGKDRATGKLAYSPADVVEELDKEEEEQAHHDDVRVEMTPTSSVNKSQCRKDDLVESQSRKKNRGANLIANSISELGNTLGKWLELSAERLAEASNSLKVDKDMFDDSRGVMDELLKMGLTDQERYAAGDKIMSMPHRVHMFWACHGEDRLKFVKSLI
ncbi:uncharacterized protein At2g29880-like [Lotus japonicus]|uniref:Myb/SANT-like domain-containing protein n=2 Tax=Lotus japonicus TaxID=34305 RepID=I3SPT3_LOTJA|nr:uncharacterized protein At2g29880-like [Lotus japonicus]AFK42275.1 unknown [Lotus japonicus]